MDVLVLDHGGLFAAQKELPVGHQDEGETGDTTTSSFDEADEADDDDNVRRQLSPVVLDGRKTVVVDEISLQSGKSSGDIGLDGSDVKPSAWEGQWERGVESWRQPGFQIWWNSSRSEIAWTVSWCLPVKMGSQLCTF